MPKILEGIRVLEWARFIQGPVAAMLLGDLGAEVIKIEHRGAGDPTRWFERLGGVPIRGKGHSSYFFEVFNRHKKSITVDMGKDAGREVIHRLVQKSDVLIINFRQTVVSELGMDYATISRLNPKLIYAQASGWGTKGPDRDAPAFDHAGQARAGTASVHELDGGATASVIPGMGDVAGGVALSHAIVAALLARERFGVGQQIEVSILSALMWLQLLPIGLRLFCGQELEVSNLVKPKNPLMNFYKAGDGKWICLAMGGMADRYWPKFCEVMGFPELEKDGRFFNAKAREENTEELTSRLKQIFSQKSRQEWLEIFKKHDLVGQPVNTVSDVIVDPQVEANQYIRQFKHPILGEVSLVASPFDFSATPVDVEGVAPALGEHTEQILGNDLGYTQKEIEELRRQQAI